MAVATQSVDISRSPDDVFWYVSDFAQFPDWQHNVVPVRPEGESVQTGSRDHPAGRSPPGPGN